MAKPRAYIGSFSLRMGPIVTRGRLVPIRKSDQKPKLNLITTEGLPVRQCYIDANGKTYLKEELGRAKPDDDGNLIPVDADAVEDAKKSHLVLNTLDLGVYPSEDIADYLFPDKSNGYIFEPIIKNSSNKVIDDPVNEKWHDVLNVLVRDSKMAFIGRCNFNNYEGMYRLSLYKGRIVVQKQLYPEEVNEIEGIFPKLTRVEKAKALKIAEAMRKEFDPNEYENDITQRLLEVTSVDFDPGNIIQPKRTLELDLESALDAALADFGA